MTDTAKDLPTTRAKINRVFITYMVIFVVATFFATASAFIAGYINETAYQAIYSDSVYLFNAKLYYVWMLTVVIFLTFNALTTRIDRLKTYIAIIIFWIFAVPALAIATSLFFSTAETAVEHIKIMMYRDTGEATETGGLLGAYYHFGWNIFSIICSLAYVTVLLSSLYMLCRRRWL